MVRTMIRLSGGPKNITGEVNLEAYLEQASAYNSLLDSSWDKLLQNLSIMDRTHPFCSVRAREIAHWGKGSEFGRLLAAVEQLKNQPFCSQCGSRSDTQWKFCPVCGFWFPKSDQNPQQGGGHAMV